MLLSVWDKQICDVAGVGLCVTLFPQLTSNALLSLCSNSLQNEKQPLCEGPTSSRPSTDVSNKVLSFLSSLFRSQDSLAQCFVREAGLAHQPASCGTWYQSCYSFNWTSLPKFFKKDFRIQRGHSCPQIFDCFGCLGFYRNGSRSHVSPNSGHWVAHWELSPGCQWMRGLLEGIWFLLKILGLEVAVY